MPRLSEPCPEPKAQKLKPKTQNLKPKTQNPKPENPNPETCQPNDTAMNPKPSLALAAAASLAVAAIAALRGPGELTMNGKSVETTFLVQGGRTFVPLSDVAKLLGATASKTSTGYALSAVGAGSMVTGTEGKVGQTLGTPQMQFSVQSVSEADHYDRKFGSGAVDALGANVRLIIVVCRVRNATAKTVSICTVGAGKTAMTDQDEHSYEVFTGDGPRNVDVLPGAVTDFGLVFQVPKTEKLKALVYETDGFPKKQIFRVAMPAPAANLSSPREG